MRTAPDSAIRHLAGVTDGTHRSARQNDVAEGIASASQQAGWGAVAPVRASALSQGRARWTPPLLRPPYFASIPWLTPSAWPLPASWPATGASPATLTPWTCASSWSSATTAALASSTCARPTSSCSVGCSRSEDGPGPPWPVACAPWPASTATPRKKVSSTTRRRSMSAAPASTTSPTPWARPQRGRRTAGPGRAGLTA